MSKTNTTKKAAYNRQKMQREALQLASERGWRVMEAKGDQLILRR